MALEIAIMIQDAHCKFPNTKLFFYIQLTRKVCATVVMNSFGIVVGEEFGLGDMYSGVRVEVMFGLCSCVEILSCICKEILSCSCIERRFFCLCILWHFMILTEGMIGNPKLPKSTAGLRAIGGSFFLHILWQIWYILWHFLAHSSQ